MPAIISQPDVQKKLEILSSDAKYDLACACGSSKDEHRRRGADGRWIYPVVLPNGGTMMTIYVALIGAYAGHKEWQRWTGSELRSLWGSWFVYAWFFFFLAAFIINNIRPSFELPKDLSKVCMEVLAFLLGSKISKSFYESRTEKKEFVEHFATRNEQVGAFVKEHGKVTAKDVKALFSVSKSSATRILSEMEAAGMIRQEGEGKGSYYTLGA